MKRCRALWLVWVGLLLILCSSGCRSAEREHQIADRPRRGGLDVTFLVTADTHFGAKGLVMPGSVWNPGRAARRVPVERVHETIIEQMNSMAGRPFPREVGGRVGRPLGVLIAGDLTEDGERGEWDQFAAYYGLTGEDGRLRLPVYESVGNHDWHWGWHVSRQVAARHGARWYSWDWGDLHVVCLGGPGDGALAWLGRDLAATGRDRPVVLYFHYPLIGPYSEAYWFGQDDHRRQFRDAITGFNVIAIFHGHFHGSGYYRWEGLDVHNVGSAKHGWKSFAVVHVSDERLTVASWNYEQRGWWWLHSRPINEAAGEGDGGLVKTYPRRGARHQPLIPHPRTDYTR